MHTCELRFRVPDACIRLCMLSTDCGAVGFSGNAECSEGQHHVHVANFGTRCHSEKGRVHSCALMIRVAVGVIRLYVMSNDYVVVGFGRVADSAAENTK